MHVSIKKKFLKSLNQVVSNVNVNYEKIPDQSVLTGETCGVKDKHGNLL